MNPALLVLASIALGVLIGAGTTVAIVGARRAGVRRAAEMRPELPEVATSILDEIDTFAVILDSSLAPVYANRTAREERHIGDAELADPDFLARVRQVMSTGIPDTHEPDPNHSADTVRIHIVRFQRRFVLILAEDLGEEQRVNAMRRDFIANVSHELKTPIAAIGLLAEATQQAADEPELVREFSKSLVKESRRLGELSRDIIQLSEAQSALRPEDRESVSLRDLVRGEVDSHRSFAGQHDVELVITDDSVASEDSIILGRPTSLASAVANLLSNAIRHSPEGGRVGIGMSAERGRFTVTVTDQGEGIAPEHLPRIFERFYRVDGARTRGDGGTGLGLSIARHTMRAHGGDVDVWSQPDVGSSFTLTFPLHEASSSKGAKRIKKAKRAVRTAAERTSQSAQTPAAQAAKPPKGTP
ncbi:cell wall metabolism sensor histidine kinase WalK [Leucobacter luti]|uniref:Sensor-like histidine kinase SenX3 n=1 Tax=Leucobacter luti TaxID=340320 RepID=A0A4R6S899_9MICO|nr:ATP-binding protein [Leucobacter luti]QYM75256.1 histidine kinase [Leucobacter luti]TDP95527.1 two-component system sensor histidine kinase SenX3 [Leucobacter luti]